MCHCNLVVIITANGSTHDTHWHWGIHFEVNCCLYCNMYSQITAANVTLPKAVLSTVKIFAVQINFWETSFILAAIRIRVFFRIILLSGHRCTAIKRPIMYQFRTLNLEVFWIPRKRKIIVTFLQELHFFVEKSITLSLRALLLCSHKLFLVYQPQKHASCPNGTRMERKICCLYTWLTAHSLHRSCPFVEKWM